MHEFVTASQYRVAGSHQSAWLTAGDASAVSGMAANANAKAARALRDCGRVFMGSHLCVISAELGVSPLGSLTMKHFASRPDIVTSGEPNGVLAKLLSDALAPKARGLNFDPYRGTHVARYPMAAIPPEAHRPLVLAYRTGRTWCGREVIGQQRLGRSTATHQSPLDRRRIAVIAGDVETVRRANRPLQFERHRHGR